MPRWHNLVVALAIFFAAGALWPWSALNRYLSAGIAFALIFVVLVARLQVHAKQRPGTRATTEEMQSRIDRIRSERERRYGRRG